jgi:hypothetical protein
MRSLRYGLNDMPKEMKHSYCDSNDTCVKDGDAHHLHTVIVESRQQINLMRNMRDNRVLVDRFYSIVSDPAPIRQRIVNGHPYPGSLPLSLHCLALADGARGAGGRSAEPEPEALAEPEPRSRTWHVCAVRSAETRAEAARPRRTRHAFFLLISVGSGVLCALWEVGFSG